MASEKYHELESVILEAIDDEIVNRDEAKKSAGINCPGCCMAMGAIDAYREVLRMIDDVEVIEATK